MLCPISRQGKRRRRYVKAHRKKIIPEVHFPPPFLAVIVTSDSQGLLPAFTCTATNLLQACISPLSYYSTFWLVLLLLKQPPTPCSCQNMSLLCSQLPSGSISLGQSKVSHRLLLCPPSPAPGDPATNQALGHPLLLLPPHGMLFPQECCWA